MATYIVKRDCCSGVKSFDSLEDALKFCNGLKDKFNIMDLNLWQNDNDIWIRIDISYDEKYRVSDKEFLELLNIFIIKS